MTIENILEIPQPHDHFFRASMSDLQIARAFFEQHLPPAVRSLINLNQLQVYKENFVNAGLGLSVMDMLFTVSFGEKNTPGYLYLLIEHLSQPEALTPFWLLVSIVKIMEDHLKNSGTKRLPIIYPVVFYTGEKRYTHSTDIFDLFGEFSALARDIFLKPFQLIDIHRIPDEELKAHTLINVMEIVMKNIRQDAFSLFKDMLSCLEAAEEAGSQAYVQNALTYLLSTGEMQNSQLFIDTVRATLSPKTGEIIMTGAQQIAAEGEARGMKKGETLFLIRLLQLKFRHIPQIYQQKIAEADADTLLIWGARVLTATALEDIFVEAC